MPDPLYINPDLIGQPDPIPFFQIFPHVNNNSSSESDSFISVTDDSQKKEAAKNAEVDMAANAGLVDPDPFNVLASLFGLLGGLKFTEAIALLGAKIAIFSALARDYIQAAARHGDKVAALRGREVLLQAPVPDLLDNTDIDLNVEVNYTEGDIKDALGTAYRKEKEKNIKRKIRMLNEAMLTIATPSLKENLKKDKIGLTNLTEG